MNDWYFIQDKGKTVGPIGLDEVRTRIRNNELRIFDLIFKDGDEEWRMALDHDGLRSEFQASTLTSLRERPWICLRRRGDEVELLDFVTSGPFTADEIRRDLQAGGIRYDDYAWKDGLSGWARIGALEEFNSRLKSKGTQPEPKFEPGKELLRNIVEMQRPQPLKSEPPPPETKGPDLTKVESAVAPVEPPASTKVIITPSREDRAEASAKPKVRVERRKRKRSRIDWGLVGVFFLLLVATLWVGTQVIMPRIRSALSSGPLTVESPAPQAPLTVSEESPSAAPPELETSEALSPDESVKPKTAAKPSPPPKIPREPKAPTELFLNVQMLNANQARIEIRTNGTAEFPVTVQVIGMPGQISEGGSFYRLSRYTPSGDSTKPLDLSDLKFPQGKFIMRVETGTLKRETVLKMGIGDPAYKQAVVRQRKMWANSIWKERLTLFKLSQLLVKQIAMGMVPTKKFSTKGLESLVSVKRSSGAQYFLFDSWWELHQIVVAAKAGIGSELLARAQKEQDRLAAFSVWK